MKALIRMIVERVSIKWDEFFIEESIKLDDQNIHFDGKAIVLPSDWDEKISMLMVVKCVVFYYFKGGWWKTFPNVEKNLGSLVANNKENENKIFETIKRINQMDSLKRTSSRINIDKDFVEVVTDMAAWEHYDSDFFECPRNDQQDLVARFSQILKNFLEKLEGIKGNLSKMKIKKTILVNSRIGTQAGFMDLQHSGNWVKFRLNDKLPDNFEFLELVIMFLYGNLSEEESEELKSIVLVDPYLGKSWRCDENNLKKIGGIFKKSLDVSSLKLKTI